MAIAAAGVAENQQSPAAAVTRWTRERESPRVPYKQAQSLSWPALPCLGSGLTASPRTRDKTICRQRLRPQSGWMRIIAVSYYGATLAIERRNRSCESQGISKCVTTA